MTIEVKLNIDWEKVQKAQQLDEILSAAGSKLDEVGQQYDLERITPNTHVSRHLWETDEDFRLRILELIKGTAPNCSHEWITTVGIFQSWEDCKHCGIKREDI